MLEVREVSMAGSFWALNLLFVFVGSWLALRRLARAPAPTESQPAVSILKPLKGADPGLRENLETFFLLDYPEYELLFSVAEGTDPAVAVVNELRRKYPAVISRLLVGAEAVGLNPKVNNLTRSYRQASHDVILISDSNVRVAPDYLRRKVAELRPGVGVVTATVAGLAPEGWGGRLEAMYLNTFYARGLSLAFASGNPCVIGKSMMFRRSVAARFGGIRALGDYLAEDYALGEAMRKIGLTVALAAAPIDQHIGSYSFRAFWDRHLRWGRIRKAHAPGAFLLEPLFTPAFAGLFAGIAGGVLAGTLTVAAWAACDLALMARFSRRLDTWAPAAWLAREALSLPLWVAVASGNSVHWRGTTLQLAIGGKISVEESEWSFSGEPRPARTKWKDITSTATGGPGRPRAILREG
jgi:ceramide glucosyltransferase